MTPRRNFVPDCKNIENAARNIEAVRLPLYEHSISQGTIEKITGKNLGDLLWCKSRKDKEEYFDIYCSFFRDMGYDTVSFEMRIGPVMPHSGLLAGHGESVINTYKDFEDYPWDIIPDAFFNQYGEMFEVLREKLPEGMRAVGGPGNGLFECVQDIVGYMNLCGIKGDYPELYEAVFKKTGEIILKIWQRFMKEFGDAFCVMRIGDDLGFKSSTLLSPDDIRSHIIPSYTKIIKCAHSYNKPFLFHSCGCIFEVMQDFINTAKIDAKHSNEDEIAPFPVWVEKYGKEIGNFGGIDMDVLCQLPVTDIRSHVHDILDRCKNGGGIAFSTGNSIPDYVPVDNYAEMVEAVRVYRGE